MNASRICKRLLLTITLFLVGCGLLDQSATKKPSNSGLIATPVTYYSTSRARYLGAKYKENLDRLVERIVRNTKTCQSPICQQYSIGRRHRFLYPFRDQDGR